MNLLFLIVVFGFAISPGFYLYLKTRRRHILAEQECRISAALTELEQMLCDAVLTQGDVCHDQVFQAMRRIQSKRRYHLKGVLRAPSAEQITFIEQFHHELDSHEPRLSHTMETFASAYMRAARIKHPIQFYPTILCLLIFKCGLPTLRHIQNLRVTWAQIRETLRREYVARSMSELHA